MAGSIHCLHYMFLLGSWFRLLKIFPPQYRLPFAPLSPRNAGNYDYGPFVLMEKRILTRGCIDCRETG